MICQAHILSAISAMLVYGRKQMFESNPRAAEVMCQHFECGASRPATIGRTCDVQARHHSLQARRRQMADT